MLSFRYIYHHADNIFFYHIQHINLCLFWVFFLALDTLYANILKLRTQTNFNAYQFILSSYRIALGQFGATKVLTHALNLDMQGKCFSLSYT